MKFNFKTILGIFVGALFLLSCQTEVRTETEAKTSSPPKKETPKSTFVQQKTPPNLKYEWQSNFNVETSIINQIPTPTGFERLKVKSNSFQEWLQFLPLFPAGQKVKTYDGSLKWNQQVHARVVDIDVGKRDLQQCADAVMRLRSEFLFGKKEYDKIHFNYTNGTKVSFDDWRKGKKPQVKGNKVTFSNSGKKDNSYANFKKYLIQIFSYAGTASLEKEMKSIPLKDMQIGDVLIQGGHPGHAIIIVDMAENTNGKKLYLLAQSYMPAQNIHILNNPTNKKLSPWYELIPNQSIHTPEWDFSMEDLKRFVD
ncbi:MAG: DUF4846 domain-containing protein [Saprospiraceae bacterium]